MRHRGFTLMEMLVTLVLVSLVSTLLWQALAQAARIEAQLADTRVLGEREALQRAWVQQALAGVATGPMGDGTGLEGREDRLEATTSMPPWPVASGLERMVLSLRTDNRGASPRTTLLTRRGEAEPLPLWQWEGSGRFEYLDADDRWQPRWPPGTGAAPVLPRAIRLLGPREGALWVPVLAMQNPMISRRDVQQDDALQ